MERDFLIDEKKDTVFDLEKMDEWKGLVEKLGLNKQAELVGNAKSILPFPALAEYEEKIYREVFGVHEEYTKFGNETIPLRVLTVISLCVTENYFTRIEIWYSKEIKDPLVIGVMPGEYSWENKYYKIAQWGERLIDAGDLLKEYVEKREADIEQSFENSKSSLSNEIAKFKLQIKAHASKN